jgi:hypothetical protein
MPRELPVADAWKEYIVTTKTLTGEILFLVSVRKEECELCRYGTRVLTTWSTHSGETQLIYWCTSCFNADCFPIELDESAARRLDEVSGHVRPEDLRNSWNGAKPAIEDLERRGLV